MSLLIVCFVIIAVVYIKEYKSFNRSLLSVLGDRQREASQSGKRPSRHKKKPAVKAPGAQLDKHMREFRDDSLMFEQLPEQTVESEEDINDREE
ncbi:MAG: hypothetical protein LIO86_09715 [Lachnospiraceae bacterium]|nr:hypothetical protein [Lachnospiraceae bacterium]